MWWASLARTAATPRQILPGEGARGNHSLTKPSLDHKERAREDSLAPCVRRESGMCRGASLRESLHMAAEDDDTEDEAQTEGGEGDGGEGDGDGEGEGKKGRLPRKKLIMLAGAGIIVLGALGGGGAYFLGFIGGEDGPVEAVAKPAVFYDLPDLTINLASPDKRSQYLRIKVALEVSKRETIDEITPMLPRVMDAFQVYLRELRMTDLEGSAGIYRLKEELRRRVNLAIHPAQVDDILFKELLIQ